MMEYKGYRIEVRWNNKSLGYDFYVCDFEDRVKAQSDAAYFYEENEENAAKEAVDRLLEAVPRQN